MKKYDWEIERDAHYASIYEEINKENEYFHNHILQESHIRAFCNYEHEWVFTTVQEDYIPW